MKNSIIRDILENKRSVREIITSLCEDGENDDSNEILGDLVGDDKEILQLFVRRWKKGADNPTYRGKVTTAEDALTLFFDWIERYKGEKVEIWSGDAQSAKHFYRVVNKNRSLIGHLWEISPRIKKSGIKWSAAYHDIHSKLNSSDVTGTLYPFVCEV